MFRGHVIQYGNCWGAFSGNIEANIVSLVLYN